MSDAAAAVKAPKVKAAPKPKSVKKGKKTVKKFTIDCSAAVENEILDMAKFVSNLFRCEFVDSTSAVFFLVLLFVFTFVVHK